MIVKKFDLKKIVLLGIVVGSTISIKSHTAMVLLASLSALGVLQIFKRNFQFLAISLLGIVVAIVFMYSTFASSKQALMISPLWFIKTMYEAPDRLNFDVWELKRQYLLSVGGYRGIAKLYVEGLVIFMGVNLSFLPLGFLALRKKMESGKRRVVALLGLIAVFSIIFTMLFIYRGIAIITIQFFYMAIIALSLLCSIVLAGLYKKNKLLGFVIFSALWLSLLPGVFHTVKVYSSDSYVSKKLVAGLSFLKGQKNGAVLVDPAYSQNSLVSAYSGKSVYYSDEIILSTLSIYFEARKREVEDFFKCNDKNEMSRMIKENNIRYIFSSAGSKCLGGVKFLQKPFSNGEIAIYQVI